VYASSTSALATGSALTFDGTNLGLGGTTNSYGSQTTFTLSGTNVSRVDFRSNSVFTGTILSYQSNTEGLRLQTQSGYPITFYPASSEAMRLTTAGYLGIGTSSPSQSLEVNGNIFVNTASGNPSLTVKTGGSGNNPFVRLQFSTNYWDIQGTGSDTGKELYFIYTGTALSYINSSTGVYVPVSDQRLKKDITDISYGLSAIMALRAVEYLMKTETEGSQKHLGFIAQEAQAVIPNAVSEMTGGMYGMDKTEIVPVLVKAVQELSAKVTALEAKLGV